VDGFPFDHHPATLTWKVIDLTTEQRQTQHHHHHQQQQQQQAVVSAAQWQPLQYVHNAGHRRYVGELSRHANQIIHCLLCHDFIFGMDILLQWVNRPYARVRSAY